MISGGGVYSRRRSFKALLSAFIGIYYTLLRVDAAREAAVSDGVRLEHRPLLHERVLVHRWNVGRGMVLLRVSF